MTKFFEGAAEAGFGTVIGIFRRNQLARMISSFELSEVLKRRKPGKMRKDRCYFNQNPLDTFLKEQHMYLMGLKEARKQNFITIDLTSTHVENSCEAVGFCLKQMHTWSNISGLSSESYHSMHAECVNRIRHTHSNRVISKKHMEDRIGLAAAANIR